jgi:hypothetical protein
MYYPSFIILINSIFLGILFLRLFDMLGNIINLYDSFADILKLSVPAEHDKNMPRGYEN